MSSTRPSLRTTTTTTTHPSGESKILKLFETPLFNSQTALGLPPQDARQFAVVGATTHAGAEMQVRSIRRAQRSRRQCPASLHPDPFHR